MTDIVKKLRNHALPDPHDEREVLHAPLLKEAADEIDRLRSLLKQCKEALALANTNRYFKAAVDALAAIEKVDDD